LNLSVEQLPRPLQTLARALRVDLRPGRQPSWALILFATLVAIVGSLVADYLLIKLGTAVFPSTKGFVHFRFSDYAKLTVIGVVIACASWPIVTRLTSTPRPFFFRLAIAVTLVLLVPDAWIWAHGEPGKAVFVLVWMHAAIGVVTYNALVRLAPTSNGRHALSPERGPRRH
jgi:hypothetical protein